jgi:hypothetical protein
VPIDPTEPAHHDGTPSRRAFLSRTAAGGALAATVVGIGAGSGIARLGATAAGAQESPVTPVTVMHEFAAVASRLELSAAQAYQAALDNDTVSQQWRATLGQFRRNHQQVATLLDGLRHPDDPPLVADPAVTQQFSPPRGTSETDALGLLAELEERLSATHLGAIETFDVSAHAKIVTQVLAVESQHAVVLGRAAGTPIAELTPATGPTDNPLTVGQAPAVATVETGEGGDEEGDGDTEDGATTTTEPDDAGN